MSQLSPVTTERPARQAQRRLPLRSARNRPNQVAVSPTSRSVPIVRLMVLLAMVVASWTILQAEQRTPLVDTETHTHSDEESQPIEALRAYVDADFGFRAAVPQGWRTIIAAESEDESEAFEPSYAVGFEMPRTHRQDVFSDYLMIEISPGSVDAAFAQGSDRSDVIWVDGYKTARERVLLNAHETSNGEHIDLVVHQATLRGVGFTVGLYGVSEPKAEEVMHAAFIVLLKTFDLLEDPYVVL